MTVKGEADALFEVRADEPDGQLLAAIEVKAGSDYVAYTAPVSEQISQRHAVYLRLISKKKEGRIKVRSLSFSTGSPDLAPLRVFSSSSLPFR